MDKWDGLAQIFDNPKGYKQCFGNLYSKKDNTPSYCAIGLIRETVIGLKTEYEGIGEVLKAFWNYMTQPRKSPLTILGFTDKEKAQQRYCPLCRFVGELGIVIIHINDYHHKKFYEIKPLIYKIRDDNRLIKWYDEWITSFGIIIVQMGFSIFGVITNQHAKNKPLLVNKLS